MATETSAGSTLENMVFCRGDQTGRLDDEHESQRFQVGISIAVVHLAAAFILQTVCDSLYSTQQAPTGSVRFSHISNSGLDIPNSGLNYLLPFAGVSTKFF